MRRRLFSTFGLLQHENPLVITSSPSKNLPDINFMKGLPRKGTPPQLPRMQRGLPEKRNIRDVKKIVAVSSAKGGVGKSTIASWSP
jgi:ATP-binding protein involved in chromosome partitioning